MRGNPVPPGTGGSERTGVISCRTTGTKDTAEVVLTFDRGFLVPTRANDGHEAAGY